MTVYVQLPVRIYVGGSGLQQWQQAIDRNPRSTLVLAGTSATRGGSVLDDILDALGHPEPHVEMRAVEHPRMDQAHEIYDIFSRHEYRRFVAIGGGSILDLAKATLYLQLHGAFDTELQGGDGYQELPTRLVAVPTTLSGAEVNPGFGVVDAAHDKQVFWEERLAPRDVICHPGAFNTAPPDLMLASGINSLAHCLEGLYTRARNPWCDPLSLDAVRRLVRWLPEAKNGTLSPKVTAELQQASVEAGWVAFGSNPALHHAICHVLGSRLALGHATANALMLPHVLATVPPEAWGDRREPVVSVLRRAFPHNPGGVAELVDAFIHSLLGIPPRLRNYASPSQLPELAKAAASQPLSRNHPVSMTAAEVEALLQEAW